MIDDSDRDGVADADEMPLAGAVVYLDSDDDGTLDAGEASRTTFKITYADGSVAVKKATFYRCSSARPQYTG